jgi:type IV pilus assembly protein PilY1
MLMTLGSLAGLVPAARADDDDIFLTDPVAPNVVILFDSSGSMRDTIGGVQKIDIAKDVVTELVTNVTNVNFGVFKFNGASTGGAMVAPLGTDPDEIVSLVNGISATGNTPLGNTLDDIQDYYLGLFSAEYDTSGHSSSGGGCWLGGDGGDEDDEDGDDEDWDDEDGDDEDDEDGDGCGNFPSPLELACQQNYVVVVTDGLPTGEDQHLVAEVATSLFATDHGPSIDGLQNVIVYTVGFDIPAAAELLQETADNGGGEFYSATNAATLEAALTNALTLILEETYSFAAPSFPSTSASDTDHAYLASFEPNSAKPFWEGSLKAYARDAEGLVPVDGNGIPLESAVAWDAGALLAAKTAASRTIYTSVGANRQTFVTTNATITQAMLGVSSSGRRTQIMNFVRGLDTYDHDGDANTTEQRDWKLGDIFHSAPVLVFDPPLETTDESYQTFKTTHENRTHIVLVGANDGMLHAFQASNGQELWGFIPNDLLDELTQMSPAVGTHRHWVDGTPVVADVKLSGTWKTIALFGERRGGRYYVALDISDTTNPGYLWSFTSTRLGETWSTPVIGKVKLTGDVTKYVAFVGGGYNTASNNTTGKAFFVIDLETGTKLWEYYNTGSNDAAKMSFSLAATPTAVDLNHDGYTDRVYVGDVGGQLWKFDVSAVGVTSGGVVTNWTGKRMFAADPTQANPPAAGAYYPAQGIYGDPAVSRYTAGNLWLYFGTGDRNHPNATSSNRFYAFKDDGSMTNNAALTEDDLTDVTTGPPDDEVETGWFIELRDDEKVFDGPTVFARTVYFSTYTPGDESSDECSQEAGTARLWAVGMLDGQADDPWDDDADDDDERSKTIGSGIPSKTQVAVDADGDALLVVGTTSEEVTTETLPTDVEFNLRYWREVF